MGIFSTKKKTVVASTVYNMAGDVADRSNYLKTTVASSVLGDAKSFVGETIVNSHLNGPGIRQRGVQRWAKNHYAIGTPTASITKVAQLDPTDVVASIPKGSNEVIEITNTFVTPADFIYYAEKHIIDNHPELYDTDWIADMDFENEEILIEYEDTTIEVVPLVGYDPDAQYVVAYFNRTLVEYSGPLSTGSVQSGDPGTVDFAFQSSTDTLVDPIVINETVHTLVEYSDSQPNEETTVVTPSDTSFTENESIYIKTEYNGYNLLQMRREYLDTTRHIFTDYITVSDDVVTVETEDFGTYTKTTTTTTTTESLQTVYSYRDDTQERFADEVVNDLEMFIYEIGGVNTTLNALVTEITDNLGEFYPFVPLRLNNKAIDHVDFEDDYPLFKRAYKKMTTANIRKILDSIEDNDDVGDIDFIFMMYGAPLNTEDESTKRYIYEFVDNLIQYQEMSIADYNSYKGAAQAKFTYDQALAAWQAGQNDTRSGNYGDPRPVYVPPATKKTSTIRIKSGTGEIPSFNQSIEWITVDKTTISGVYEVGAKQNDVKIEANGTDLVVTNIRTDGEGNTETETERVDKFRITYQTETDEYVTLDVYGMVHRNTVYGGTSVEISSSAALADNDESGFLFFMHAPTVNKMSLIDSTQMATTNTFLIMNSYEIIKTRWYERGIFKIIITIVVIVITAVIAPQLTGAAAGLLGTNLAVGTALGFTGTAAVVAGAVANAIAAIILTRIISNVSVNIFGEKIGAIVAAIVTFVVTAGLGGFTNGGMTINWANMMRIDNIMALTSTAANAYAGWINGDTLEIQQELTNLEDTFEKKFDELEDLTKELGLDQGYINPLMFTEFTQSDELYSESSESFLNRTTMTANDFIDLSFSMIYDFTEMTTKLDKG